MTHYLNGFVPDIECKRCDGNGWIPRRWAFNSRVQLSEEDCPDCAGHGWRPMSPRAWMSPMKSRRKACGPGTLRRQMMSDEKLVALAQCPPGPFVFEMDGRQVLGFKTEYGSMETVGPVDVPGSQIRWRVGRWPDAYVMESGEVFWGGTKTQEERAALLVRPCDVRATPADAEPVAYQRRWMHPDIPGYVPQWHSVSKEEATGHFEKLPGYEYRALFAHPPTDTRRVLEEAARVARSLGDKLLTDARDMAKSDPEGAVLRIMQGDGAIAAGDAIRALIPQPAPAAERVKMLEDYVRDASDVLGDLLCDQEVGEPDIDEDPLVDLLRRARALLKGGEHG